MMTHGNTIWRTLRWAVRKVFTKLLEDAGLPGPFDEETIKAVCKRADTYLSAYDLTGIKSDTRQGKGTHSIILIQNIHVDISVNAGDLTGAACLPQNIRTFVVRFFCVMGKPYRPYVCLFPYLFQIVFAAVEHASVSGPVDSSSAKAS